MDVRVVAAVVVLDVVVVENGENVEAFLSGRQSVGLVKVLGFRRALCTSGKQKHGTIQIKDYLFKV